MSTILATGSSGTNGALFSVIYLVVIVGIFYMFMIRPQRKEQKAKELMLHEIAVGDTIMTTGGFYGTIIDVDDTDNTVIVEFGSNKNCRIPMQKSAIAEVEKPEEAAVEKK